MKTIIAVLDRYKEAEQLKKKLIGQGLKSENIEIGRATRGKLMKIRNRKSLAKLISRSSEEKHTEVRGYYPGGPHGEESFIAISVNEDDAMLANEVIRRHRVVYMKELA